MTARRINLKRSTIARLQAFASTLGVAVTKSRRGPIAVSRDLESERRAAADAEDLLGEGVHDG